MCQVLHKDHTGLKNTVCEIQRKRVRELVRHRSSQRYFAVEHRVFTIYQCFMENGKNPDVIIGNEFWIVGIKTEMSFRKISGCCFVWNLLVCVLSHLLEIKIEMCLAALQIFSSCLNHTVAPQMKHLRHQPSHKQILVHSKYLQTWNAIA